MLTATRPQSASHFVTVSPSSVRVMAIASTRGGRKSKGARVFRAARLPEYVDEALIKAVESEGVSLNDFIVNAVAARCGLAEPFPGRPPLFDPEELALQKAG